MSTKLSKSVLKKACAWNRLTAMRGLLVYFTRNKKQFSDIAKQAAKEELETVLDRMGIAH